MYRLHKLTIYRKGGSLIMDKDLLTLNCKGNEGQPLACVDCSSRSNCIKRALIELANDENYDLYYTDDNNNVDVFELKIKRGSNNEESN